MVRGIFHGPGLASFRCRPLSSNVRHQNNRDLQFQQEVRLAAWIEQPQGGQAASLVLRRKPAATGSTDGKKPIKQPDCSQGRRERRPVQTYDDARAATGGCSALRAGRSGPGRVKKRISAVRDPGHTQERRQECQVVAHAARRGAPCKVLGRRRRRGVPRLLLSWRGAGSRISRMQMHFGLPAARTDA